MTLTRGRDFKTLIIPTYNINLEFSKLNLLSLPRSPGSGGLEGVRAKIKKG
jgi:hypothetical protein